MNNIKTLFFSLLKKNNNDQNTEELYQNNNDQNAEELYQLGQKYIEGLYIGIDRKIAFEHFRKAADLGHLCALGECYRYGIGVEKDEQMTFEYYQKAADMSDTAGIFNIGTCYEYGIGVKKDKQKTFEYYQKSANMGYVHGIREVGWCYRIGLGIKQDEQKAFKYYQKAANMGDAAGINSVGICYFNGIGVEMNKKKAIEYYKKSAEMGHIIATYNVGDCYENGDGVGKDSHKAFEYYKKSAEMGFPDGMYSVGEYYRKGVVVEKDIDIAFEWYLKSAITEKASSSTIKKPEFFHWMAYDKFQNIEEIGSGAFSTVFRTKYLNQSGSYEEVAIKIVKDSNKNKEPFLKELKACHSLEQYLGISRDEKTDDYILVTSYAKYGSLSKNLANIFKFEWKIKLKILRDIIFNLNRIHYKRYLHRDLHPGNILLKEDYEAYITDLGLSKPLDEKEHEDQIHGVLPYVAPELFQREPYTQAADIYSFGIIMVEMTTGLRPFDSHKFDMDLVIMICKGLRPKFGIGTPNYYVELANRCMDSNPEKRPTINEIITKLNEWLEILNENSENEIKKQFLESDNINKNYTIIKEELKNIYTSKPFNTLEISERLSKLNLSKSVGIGMEIPNDI